MLDSTIHAFVMDDLVKRVSRSTVYRFRDGYTSGSTKSECEVVRYCFFFKRIDGHPDVREDETKTTCVFRWRKLFLEGKTTTAESFRPVPGRPLSTTSNDVNVNTVTSILREYCWFAVRDNAETMDTSKRTVRDIIAQEQRQNRVERIFAMETPRFVPKPDYALSRTNGDYSNHGLWYHGFTVMVLRRNEKLRFGNAHSRVFRRKTVSSAKFVGRVTFIAFADSKRPAYQHFVPTNTAGK